MHSPDKEVEFEAAATFCRWEFALRVVGSDVSPDSYFIGGPIFPSNDSMGAQETHALYTEDDEIYQRSLAPTLCILTVGDKPKAPK